MKKVISRFDLHNWNKEASAILTGFAGSFGMIAVWSDELLRLLHEAPFPVSNQVDIWVKWLLKIIASILGIVTLLTKKKNDIDLGIKITDETTPSETAMGKNESDIPQFPADQISKGEG